MRKPSIASLREVFADKAKEARAIFDMCHGELSAHPAGAARIKECFHRPKWYDVRLHALDSLGDTHGVESCETESGEFADYLNTGDSYAPTVIFWRGNYRVQSLGDFIEIQQRNGVPFK